jgi:hypothetical protein
MKLSHFGQRSGEIAYGRDQGVVHHSDRKLASLPKSDTLDPAALSPRSHIALLSGIQENKPVETIRNQPRG